MRPMECSPLHDNVRTRALGCWQVGPVALGRPAWAEHRCRFNRADWHGRYAAIEALVHPGGGARFDRRYPQSGKFDSETQLYPVGGHVGDSPVRQDGKASGRATITGDRRRHHIGGSAQTGSIVVTSRAAALPSKRTLAATPGTVSLTGFAAGLSTSTGKQLIAVPGAVLLNGTLANLVTGRKLRFVADAGTLLLTGQPIAFSRAVHAIILSRGAVVTGSDIDLIHGAVSGNTLLAEPGTIALSGQLASLRVGHVLPPDLPPPGVFVPTRRAFIPNRW